MVAMIGSIHRQGKSYFETTKIIGNFNPHWVRYHNHEYLVEGGVDCAYMHGENPEGIPYYIVIN